jgi:hypothetical protein
LAIAFTAYLPSAIAACLQTGFAHRGLLWTRPFGPPANINGCISVAAGLFGVAGACSCLYDEELAMTREKRFLLGMIAGWLTVAVLSVYIFRHRCVEGTGHGQSPSEEEDRSSANAPTDVLPTSIPREVRPSTRRPPSLTLGVASVEPEPREAASDDELLSVADLHRPVPISHDDDSVNPFLGIAATKSEVEALTKIGNEYNRELMGIVSNYSGDELRKRSEAVANRYLPRFEGSSAQSAPRFLPT